jgi:hypothetical protein
MVTVACKAVKVRSSAEPEYQIRGAGHMDGMKTKAGYDSDSSRRGPSFDHATVQLEAIDFGPKMAFSSPTLAPTCPFPRPTLLRFYRAKSPAPFLAGYCSTWPNSTNPMPFNFAISSKLYQDYKVSCSFAYSDTPTRFLRHADAPPLYLLWPSVSASPNFTIAYSPP